MKEDSITTKDCKGAWENCGAMTHSKKDCFEGPKRVGAKFPGTDITPDEHVQPQLMLDDDGKRDRRNGCNPEEHVNVLEEYAKVDLAKQMLKAQKHREELASVISVEQSNSLKHQWGGTKFSEGRRSQK